MATRKIQVTPTISTAIYAAGDAVGGLMTFEPVAPAASTPGKAVRITQIRIIDRDGEGVALDVHVFQAAFTPVADNAVFAVSDADSLNRIATVSFVAGDYKGDAANKVATKSGLAIDVVLPANGNALYAQMSTSATPTFTSTSDLLVEITVQDI